MQIVSCKNERFYIVEVDISHSEIFQIYFNETFNVILIEA